MKNINDSLNRFKPKKSLGQNFLNSNFFVKETPFDWKIRALNILEIGPGFGILTNFLYPKAKKILTIEKDTFLSDFLKKKYKNDKKIKILNEDILFFNPTKELKNKKYVVVSNLPFFSAIEILKWCFKFKKHFSDLYLSFSEELAQKIINKKNNSALKILCDFNAQIKFNKFISAKYFSPSPKINVIFLHFKLINRQTDFSNQNFSEFIINCFKNKRKKLINNNFLKKWISIDDLKYFFMKNKISPKIRAEELNLDFFLNLFEKIYSNTNKKRKSINI